MELPNFDSLSLHDIDMSMSLKKFEFNNIYESNNIKELLFNIYSNENPNITFEEIKDKIIEFYYNEASCELISKHLDELTSNMHVSIIAHIYEKIITIDYSTTNEYNLNAIISFITIPYGTSYLYDIFSKF